jgi:transcriptional regulator with XRE-family HTH domain
MFLPGDCQEAVAVLGHRLRQARLNRNESQSVFAARIGVSVPTLSKMEAGDPKVQFGYWIVALDILGRLADLGCILEPRENLFEKYERLHSKTRKRASRKASSGG